MALDTIRLRGARTHNLKNIDLDLPRDKLIVITGLSGSGKSSLAFDTIYAEGQRRYVESLSAYARQFLSVMDKPDIDHIEGPVARRSRSSRNRPPQPALDGRHDHRDPRLPAPAVRARRHAALPGPRLPAGSADRQPDGRPGAGDGGRRGTRRPALDAAGTGGARSQGRAPAGVRTVACTGLRARPREWPRARDRRGADAGAAPEAHHRSGDRPLQAARRHPPAPGRILRDRAEARRRHGHRAVDGRQRSRAAAVLVEVSPARSATTRCRNWNRGCSRSTRRWARARAATASA